MSESTSSLLHIWRLTSWEHVPTQCPVFLVLGCFADLRGFRSWFLKGPSFTQCKCLDLPVVSPSLNAWGCWWQGNRLFLLPTGCLPAVSVWLSHIFPGSCRHFLTCLRSSGGELLRDMDALLPVPTEKSLAGCRATEQHALLRISLKQQKATYPWRCQANPPQILELFTYI